MNNSSAIIVGAGIVGLATARALSLKGYAVTIIEKTEKAVGASIRNFGMIWPIGQPDGILYNRALRSKIIWKEVADSIGLWYNENGSLHLAYFDDEWKVLQELYDIFSSCGRDVQLMTKKNILEKFNGINDNGLIGGLYSSTEMVVNPRDAIEALPKYLSEYLDVQFVWGKAVTNITTNTVWLDKQKLEADIICICNGADFETLYPAHFSSAAITKCKLQMMRFISEKQNWQIGTSLCGGLSLIHYNSFKVAPSLKNLRKRYEEELPEYLQYGIHVMVSQNNLFELTVGDSHEYGLTFTPFDESDINRHIISYLKQFAMCSDWKLLQTWNGIYPKMTNGATEFFINPEPGIFVLNGLGGAGMTLSFGLAEEVVKNL